MDGNVKTWDIAGKKQVLTLAGHEGGVKMASWNKNDSVIVSLAHFQGGLPRIWDSKNGKLIYSIDPGEEFIDETGYCLNEKFIYTISLNDNISYFRLYDAVTHEQVMSFQDYEGYFHNPHFDSSGTKMLLSGVGRNVWLIDLKTGKPVHQINTHEEWLMESAFRDHDKKIITRERYGSMKIWDALTGKLLDSFHINSDDLLYSQMNKEATRMLLIDQRRNINELDIKTRKIKKPSSLKPGDYAVPDSILFISDEAELLMFNLPSAKFIASFINVDTDGGLVLLPNGYYFGDKSSTQKLHYVKNGMIVTFDQLDIKFNRPDLVLAAIGNQDTALLRSYRKAWEKRIKKMGIDTSFFREDYSVPETVFEDRSSIGYEQNEKMTLHIKGTDKHAALDRFNIWINEVPLFGQRGISLKNRKLPVFDTLLSVRLGRGKNIIETSVTNSNGVESYREPLTVYYTPSFPVEEKTYFIGIGIDHFSDSQYNLQYSAKDIRDLALKLKEKYGEEIIIDTLFNEQVTTANIRSLKQHLVKTAVNDKVIVAYSGHGLLNKDFDYYLSTYDINFNKPEENGLSYNELENLLDSIPSRKKLMLIDACHSGEVDKEDLVRLESSPDSLVKGLKPVSFKQDDTHFGLRNSFELMQNLFVNVGKSTGAVVISAAAGTQFALERNDLKNGVFSFCILEAMKNYPEMKVSELKKIIGEKVELLTNGLQKPTYRNETIAVDWNVW
jgi:WD40 repeat protein